MQDEEAKTEEKTTNIVPDVEIVVPADEPQPEGVSDAPVVEAVPEPVPAPIEPEPVVPKPIPVKETPVETPEPETAPTPEPTPPVAPEAPPVVFPIPEPPTPGPIIVEQAKPVEPTPKPTLPEPPKPTPEPIKEEPVVVPPLPEPAKSAEQGSIPQKVLDLTPAELDAARRLWATRTIHDAQKASVQARKVRVAHNTQRVERFVKKYGPTTVRTVGLELGMSTRSASTYLIELFNNGRINATGNTTARRYS